MSSLNKPHHSDNLIIAILEFANNKGKINLVYNFLYKNCTNVTIVYWRSITLKNTVHISTPRP